MKALRKVLVVDDDPVVGKSFDRVLSGKGYAVIHAADGAQALERLAKEDYDVVYADIKMPGMNGIEMTERIKASRPWLPVVIVTGYGSEENEARAKQAGVSAFLRKPLSPEMIEGSALDAVLEKPPLAAAAEAAEPAAETAAPAKPASAVKNVALFVAAPFIGLAYAIALPFVGIGLIAWAAYKALRGPGKTS